MFNLYKFDILIFKRRFYYDMGSFKIKRKETIYFLLSLNFFSFVQYINTYKAKQ